MLQLTLVQRQPNAAVNDAESQDSSMVTVFLKMEMNQQNR